MQVKTVSITYGRKFNLQDFNSAHIEVSTWADLDEGDDPQEVTARLFSEAKEAVKEQAMPLVRKVTADMQEVYAGLPKEVTGE